MQANYGKIKSAGLGLAAISYDSPEVLKSFSQGKNIQFPLLSDASSSIIRRFGILNTQAKPDSPTFGVPYPGIYVLDAKGVVTAKYFEDDYEERDTAAVILMKQFGIEPDEQRAIATRAKHVELATSTSDRDASMGQHLALILDVKLAPGVHVYAPGVKGYIPIEWKIDDSPGVQASAPNYPDSKLLRLPAIGETVPVYEGEFQLTRNVTIGTHAAGDLSINGTFRYQACDDQKCYLPETVPVYWTVHYQPLDRERAPADLQRKSP